MSLKLPMILRASIHQPRTLVGRETRLAKRATAQTRAVTVSTCSMLGAQEQRVTCRGGASQGHMLRSVGDVGLKSMWAGGFELPTWSIAAGRHI